MKDITIKSQGKDYTAFFKQDVGFLENLVKENAIWIIDQNVYTIFKQYFDTLDRDSLILFEAREDQKTLESVAKLYRELIAKNMKRNMSIISVGGGVTQDVTGFVASTLYRGVHWIYIPTTLLAQTDSCIGGKTSLNFDSSKNLVGTFYAPNEVYISTAFLESLKPEDTASGLGEMLKIQLINTRTSDDLSRLQDQLEKSKDMAVLLEFIHDTLLIKKTFIEEDELDNGRRRILNYGHCFGHAFESVSNFAIPHGLSVVVGMLFANIIGLKRGKIKPEIFETITQSLFLPYMRIELLDMKDEYFEADALLQAMYKDKKRSGSGLALVLPRNNLELEVVQDLSKEEFYYGLEELKKIITNVSSNKK